MRYPILRRARAWLPGALVLCAALAVPRGASAQYCTEEPCGPSDFTAPTVTISPGTSTWTGGARTVTITWSDNVMLDHASRVITFGGVDVTASFNYTITNNWTAQSVGTVTVGPGSQSLGATICDYYGGYCATSQVTYTGPAASVRVTPESTAQSVVAGTPSSSRFRVVNTGTGQTTYTSIATCPTGWGCTPSVPTVVLAPGDSAFVDLNYTPAAAGTGWVQLSAASGSVSSFGGLNVTVLAAADPGYPGDDRSLQRIQREACVIIAVGPGAASECGDLRVVHPLPEVRLLNKGHAPVLTYNSDHARPFPIVAAHLAGPAAGVPDTIRAVLLVNGVQVAQQKVRGWGPSQTRRIAISFDASNPSTYPTGVYSYTLQVTAEWVGGAQQAYPARTGRMIIVNRSASPFGAGWWLSGVEQLVTVPGDTAKLWVGGDGSARIYRGNPGGPWVADGYDRPDTLYRGVSGELGEVTVRTLPGRSEVWFDALGRHLRTINRQQQYTAFRWSGSYLAQINLPYAGAQGDSTRYQFEYNNNAAAAVRNLSRVVAPGIGTPRHTWLTTDASGRVTRITDSDSTYVGFTYSGATRWMLTRTDRRGTPQTFGYTGVRFRSASRPVSPTQTALVRVVAVAGQGWGTASVSLDSVRAVYDGPRTDLCDCMWWHTDRYGAPIDVTNALQQVTLIRRGDPRWPAHVTETVTPNGFRTTATYDERGNLAGTTAWNPYGDGRNATTTYRWDPYWDKPLQVVAAEGEVSLSGYDEFGRRSWEQKGPSASRRASFRYYAPNDPQAPGLLRAITSPALRTDSLAYDARGNLSMTATPLGFRTYTDNDALGRMVRKRTPIDSLQTSFRVDSTVYDRSGRAYRTESFGRAANGAVDQRLVVEKAFDREGLVLSVSRWSVPDTAHVGVVITRFAYDTLGRRIAEIAPDGAADSTFYDLGGNVVRTRDRRGHAAETGYDHLNRPLWSRIPGVVYADTAVDAWTFPRYPTCAGADYCIPADTATFTYDTQGNLLTADNRDARIRRTYYPGGALETDSLRIRTWAETGAGGDFSTHAYGLRLRYDRDGRRAALIYPAQLAPTLSGVRYDSAAYAYDAQGALSRVRDPLGVEFGYTYDLAGQLDRVLYPQGHFKRFTYDPDGRVTVIRQDRTSTGGSTSFTEDSLWYDARGKITTVAPGVVNALTRNYYTPLGALYETRESLPAGVSDEVTSWWTTDALANVVGQARSHTTIHWTPDYQRVERTSSLSSQLQAATGRLLSTSGYSTTSSTTSASGTGCDQTNFARQTTGFRYDPAGNQYWRYQVSTDSTYYMAPCGVSGSIHVVREGAASYYGADGKLRAYDERHGYSPNYPRATDPDVFEEYRYDALGRRVLRRERGTEILRYVWIGDHIVAEVLAGSRDTASAGTLEAEGSRVLYTHGLVLDQPLAVIRMGYKAFGPIVLAPDWDWRGRPYSQAFYGPTAAQRCASVDGPGCVYLRWPTADAYGVGYGPAAERMKDWFGSLLDDQRDASHQMYRRHRYYDAGTGRFTQEDPIGLAGGVNVYGFAEGDPVSHSDPFGLCADGVTTLACLYAAVEIGFTLYDIGDLAVTTWKWLTGRTSGRAVLVTGGAVLTGVVTWGGGYGRAAREGVEQVASSAAQAERLRASLAVQEIFGARPVGSALKSDPAHRAASFALPADGRGRMFTIRGGDGHRYNLTQVEGVLDGQRGIFEWVVNDAGELTHQRFIRGGRITGSPNQRP